MLPGIKDAKDAAQDFGYNLGLSKSRPKMGRYNFAEKAEYWALIWGGLVMGVTGFMLWNPIATSAILPGQFIPAAKAAHGGEAILAVLAIIVWHFYGVHIKTWNWSMIRGTISRHEMEEEHAIELEQIEAGKVKTAAHDPAVKKRQTIYLPIAAVLTLVLLAGVYYFVTLEVSALDTLPPATSNQQIYNPRTPTPTQPRPVPTATQAAAPVESSETGNQEGGQEGGSEAAPAAPAAPAATSAPAAAAAGETWNSGIGALFETKCKACHGTSGGLSLATYADAMKGGTSGAVIKPGDPQGSSLVSVQAAGNHMGQFSDAELNRVVEWIKAGAPEK
jgi:hypothetical protein